MQNKAIARKYSDEKGSRLLAVMIGCLIDLGGSIFVGMAATFCYGLFLGIQGVPYDEAMTAITKLHEQPLVMMVLYPVGFGLSVLGGYVCARIANYSEYRCALIQGACSFLYGFTIGMGTQPFLKSFLLSILSYGCVLLGAFIYVKMKKKHRAYLGDPSAYNVPPQAV